MRGLRAGRPPVECRRQHTAQRRPRFYGDGGRKIFIVRDDLNSAEENTLPANGFVQELYLLRGPKLFFSYKHWEVGLINLCSIQSGKNRHHFEYRIIVIGRIEKDLHSLCMEKNCVGIA